MTALPLLTSRSNPERIVLLQADIEAISRGEIPGRAETMFSGAPSAQLNGMRAMVDAKRAQIEADEQAPGLVLTCAADVMPEQVTWLWPGHIPQGKLSILEGDPGLGKSTILYDLAARITTGSTMPDGTAIERPGSVVIVSAEDGMADTIIPRLMAAGADLNRVSILEGIDSPEGVRRPISLPEDMAYLRYAVDRISAVLVTIDPLTAYLSAKVNSYRDQDVRRALHPLSMMAAETGAAVVVSRHLNKSNSGNPLYRGGGSIGIIGAARTCMIVANDPDQPDTGRVILAVSKSNVGPIPPSLAFRVETDAILNCSRIAWEPGTTRHTARDLASIPDNSQPKDGGALNEAIQFLREELEAGPRLAKDIEQLARNTGIAVATLRRAKEKLAVISNRESGPIGGTRPWFWQLPNERRRCSSEHVDAHTSEDEHLRPIMSTYEEGEL